MLTIFTDSLDSLLRTIGKPTEKKHSRTSLRFVVRQHIIKNPKQGIKVKTWLHKGYIYGQSRPTVITHKY